MKPRKDVPLNIALWFLALGENPKAKMSDVRVAAYLARNADESGSFLHPTLVEPEEISDEIDIGIASVYRALRSLDALGFISWNPSNITERFSGTSGRLRLILDHSEG